ncbi:hypothetical protein BH23ACT3_BH23ACT3_10660 [soil metagenome]
MASIGFDDDRILIVAAMPYVVHRYGVPLEEVGMFSAWADMLSHRRRLSRAHRRRFDELHAALARLAAHHSRPGTVDPVDEQPLAQQLAEAREAMRPWDTI